MNFLAVRNGDMGRVAITPVPLKSESAGPRRGFEPRSAVIAAPLSDWVEPLRSWVGFSPVPTVFSSAPGSSIFHTVK